MMVFRWGFFVCLLLAAACGYGQGCNIGPPTVQLLQANTVVATPTLGEKSIGLRISFTYQGPSSNFRIKAWIANQVRYINIVNATPGTISRDAVFEVPLDSTVPYGVILDDLHQSGDSTPNNNTLNASYTPIMPSGALAWYAPREMTGYMKIDTTFGCYQPFHYIFWFPTPITTSHQEITGVKPPKYSQVIYTTPFNQPVYQTDLFLSDAGEVNLRMDFTFIARNVKCNWEVLNRVTWSNIGSPPSDVASYLQAERIVEVNSPEVAQLVTTTLPTNYLLTMTPYQAAKALFKSVIAHVNYGYGGWSAATTLLSTGYGDCGGFSVAFMGACRKIGIPARPAVGGSEFGPHMWCEFWLGPEIGWVPVDVQTSDGFDTAGTYAYCFGYVPI